MRSQIPGVDSSFFNSTELTGSCLLWMYSRVYVNPEHCLSACQKKNKKKTGTSLQVKSRQTPSKLSISFGVVSRLNS